MPSRARRYQELVLTAKYEICIERARYVTRAFFTDLGPAIQNELIARTGFGTY